MDAMERQEAHEKYNPPVVSVGDYVLFKRTRRNVWGIGVVYPPQSINWSPGDPVGKRIQILVTEPQRSGFIAEDCYHYLDPKYTNDPNGNLNCWREIGQPVGSDLIGVYNEVLGKLAVIDAERVEQNKIIDMLRTELASLNARVNNPKATMPKMVKTEQPKLQEAAA